MQSDESFEKLAPELRREIAARLEEVEKQLERRGLREAPPARVASLLVSLREGLHELEEGSGLTWSAVMQVQHGELRSQLGGLSDLMVALRDDAAARAAEGVSAFILLSDLRRSLADHMAFEERDGKLQAAVDEAPRLARGAEQLLRQHDEFREGLQRLCEEAEAALAAPDAWEAICQGFAEVRNALLEHERAENELMRRAYVEDLGGRG